MPPMVIVILQFLAAAWAVAAGLLTLSVIICCTLDFWAARKIKRLERAQQRIIHPVTRLQTRIQLR